MKKILVRKLSLHRETLLNLETGDLNLAAGGFVTGNPCSLHCTATACGSCKVICE